MRRIPAHLRTLLPTLPIFELEDGERTETTIFTKEELLNILYSHGATRAWFIPVSSQETGEEAAIQRIFNVMEYAALKDVKYKDGYHVPDIRSGEVMFPSILVFNPPPQTLAELTALAEIDFIVELSLSSDMKDADTTPMDVILVPVCNN